MIGVGINLLYNGGYIGEVNTFLGLFAGSIVFASVFVIYWVALMLYFRSADWGVVEGQPILYATSQPAYTQTTTTYTAVPTQPGYGQPVYAQQPVYGQQPAYGQQPGYGQQQPVYQPS